MINDLTSYNRVTIEGDALVHNYRLLSSLMPKGNELLAMVKGDGYGHGMIDSARAFARAGCSVFGVAELREGVLLREAGIEGRIFIMVGFPADQVDHLFSSALTPVISTESAMELLSKAAGERGENIEFHLKVDCGMSRLGVQPDEVANYIRLAESLPGVRLGGVVSHFPEADDVAAESTPEVFSRFEKACGATAALPSVINHIANSGAVLNFPETLCDMGRAGIALYGYAPSGNSGDRYVEGTPLKPAMRFATSVILVKNLDAGTGVSYGHTYVTDRVTRVAVLPVGYEDGYPRCLSNRGEVLIRGQKAPILGRVCMNLFMVDVTEIEGVVIGDEAVLLGNQDEQSITADDIAEKAGTISYEILCMIGNNNQRVFIE